jgi:hypothetical protein
MQYNWSITILDEMVSAFQLFLMKNIRNYLVRPVQNILNRVNATSMAQFLYTALQYCLSSKVAVSKVIATVKGHN